MVGLCGTEFSVPVLGCVLVIVTELCLGQEGAELFGLFGAHPQVSTVQILFHMHKKQVSVEQKRKTKKVRELVTNGNRWLVREAHMDVDRWSARKARAFHAN